MNNIKTHKIISHGFICIHDAEGNVTKLMIMIIGVVRIHTDKHTTRGSHHNNYYHCYKQCRPGMELHYYYASWRIFFFSKKTEQRSRGCCYLLPTHSSQLLEAYLRVTKVHQNGMHLLFTERRGRCSSFDLWLKISGGGFTSSCSHQTFIFCMHIIIQAFCLTQQ